MTNQDPDRDPSNDQNKRKDELKMKEEITNANTLKVTIKEIKTGKIVLDEECRAVFCGMSGEKTISFSGCRDSSMFDYMGAAISAEIEIKKQEDRDPDFKAAKSRIKELLADESIESIVGDPERNEGEGEDNE